MARRKNVKRIDPRYFLDETANRGEEQSVEVEVDIEVETGDGDFVDESEEAEKEKKAGKKEGWERPKTASGHASYSKAGRWDRQDIANKASGRWLKEADGDQSIFAPNHYCVHHGGVQYEGQIKMAEAVNHNYDRKLNRVTHYDMRLQDGTILESVPAEDIQVVRASLAEEHSHEGGCPSEEGPATSDISQLSPEDAYAAGMAAARDAIDQAMGGPDGPPPEGGFAHLTEAPAQTQLQMFEPLPDQLQVAADTIKVQLIDTMPMYLGYHLGSGAAPNAEAAKHVQTWLKNIHKYLDDMASIHRQAPKK